MATRRTGDDDQEHSEALRYWYAQEQAPLPDPLWLADPEDDRPAMPSGWWLAPALVLSVLFWVVIGNYVLA